MWLGATILGRYRTFPSRQKVLDGAAVEKVTQSTFVVGPKKTKAATGPRCRRSRRSEETPESSEKGGRKPQKPPLRMAELLGERVPTWLAEVPEGR